VGDCLRGGLGFLVEPGAQEARHRRALDRRHVFVGDAYSVINFVIQSLNRSATR
jgi:hypothetical protein